MAVKGNKKVVEPVNETEVNAPVTPTETATPAPKAEKAPKGVIRFHMKNGTVRDFTADVHGDDHDKVADEFEATNARHILKREG